MHCLSALLSLSSLLPQVLLLFLFLYFSWLLTIVLLVNFTVCLPVCLSVHLACLFICLTLRALFRKNNNNVFATSFYFACYCCDLNALIGQRLQLTLSWLWPMGMQANWRRKLCWLIEGKQLLTNIGNPFVAEAKAKWENLIKATMIA